MKALNLTTLFLTILGGINWGLVGLFNFNLVAALFGFGTVTSSIVYIIIGLSALYQFVPFARAISIDEVPAERAVMR